MTHSFAKNDASDKHPLYSLAQRLKRLEQLDQGFCKMPDKPSNGPPHRRVKTRISLPPPSFSPPSKPMSSGVLKPKRAPPKRPEQIREPLNILTLHKSTAEIIEGKDKQIEMLKLKLNLMEATLEA